MNEVIKAIYERRSVRDFTAEPVPREHIMEILKAGSWAPSGLNNQPWRFAIVTDPALKEKFEPLTKYTRIIKSAQCLLPVFISKSKMYHETKDHQAIGACLQNMLLCAHSLGLGAVWLGEILKSGDEVRKLLGLSEDLELMAVIALGWPKNRDQKSRRIPLEELIVFDN
ncbi:Nitroreductase family protein [Dissulfuribacter thermophilus]|uniref:Nitroreductase family protein n=1 Tax=Dissulfuribacter thermophilus TaxID=1156395 RepID=A0A1B9F2R4_9BACT|nr:nitroreductase [Dissulfuribacter thermophilus]OCC14229.1 Nitroreductase family protein [Dissulfuribacter thermophilus]